MGFKVYFVSRSKLIKFLFSRLFCENFDLKVFCYIQSGQTANYSSC